MKKPIVVLAATRKGLFFFEKTGRGKTAWQVSRTAFLGQHVSQVLSDPRDGALYAGLDHGHFGVKLHRSEDAGASWKEIAVPAYPEGLPEWKDMWGKAIPMSTQKIWALEAGHAKQPGVLWCGTMPGGLFRSPDRGATWEMVKSLWDHPLRKEWMGGGADYPGIHSICLHPKKPGWIALGVSTGGVWITEDGGKNWSCPGKGMRADYAPPEKANLPQGQDVHRLVLCRATPERLWVQHHNGIFHSTDAGQNWTEIRKAGPSVFGFAVVVHPKEPDTAWFVPAVKDECRIPADGKVVVARTRDGAKSFEVLTNGLPQTHAYDLTYRHGLDLDASGKRLAFGSTTGSLWISENQGDSWRTASEHLPPVYAVRFL